MTREERLELLKQIEKDIYVCSLESTLLEDLKSCAIHSVIEELEQEPTTKNDLGVDCISREAVERIINKWLSHTDYELKDHIYSMTKKIHELSSVTPQEPRWIPVTERLPEDRREVLVTAYWHETYQVMMASYFGDGLWWCVPFNNCGEHMQRLKPKAWMPLPKPYEPQENEDKE